MNGFIRYFASRPDPRYMSVANIFRSLRTSGTPAGHRRYLQVARWPAGRSFRVGEDDTFLGPLLEGCFLGVREDVKIRQANLPDV
jgi:hypothetical protein